MSLLQNDWTALHYACSNGHTEIVKYLLTKRVKLLVPNKVNNKI